MADGIRAEGLEEFQSLSVVLKDAADKDLTNRVRKAMRDVAKPVGEAVNREGAKVMPHRGGFSRRVEGTKVGITSALVSKTVHITLTLNNKGADIKSLDAGVLRHPVFAQADRTRTWVKQTVPSGAFSKALEKQAPAVSRKILDAMQTTLTNAGKKV
jgi:hypothetical protein